MDKYDPEKLEKGNGQDGNPTLVAFMGNVYDLGSSPKWKNGKHMMRHSAGHDLTTEIKAAPHGPEVFESFELVGNYAADAQADGPVAPWPLSWIYSTFPIVKRHAHPVTVHFPIAFMLGSCLFALLYLFTGTAAFDNTAFHLVVLGTLTAPFAMVTGLQSWWLYYGLKRTGGISFKLIGGPVLMILGGAASLLHLNTPTILMDGGSMAAVYFVLLAINVPLAGTLGFVGGQMTFPD